MNKDDEKLIISHVYTLRYWVCTLYNSNRPINKEDVGLMERPLYHLLNMITKRPHEQIEDATEQIEEAKERIAEVQEAIDDLVLLTEEEEKE